MKIEFVVNGKTVKLDADPFKRLLDILRDDLDLISVKEGCGQGECGSCTVIMNGRRVNACLIPALQLDSSRIYTLEGVRDWRSFAAVERVFIEQGAVQCGFCMPGMVLSAMAVLQEISPPYTEKQIKAAIAGNMCRCTGYTKIIDTVKLLGRNRAIAAQVKGDWPE